MNYDTEIKTWIRGGARIYYQLYGARIEMILHSV